MQWYPVKLTTHLRTYSFGERLIADRLGKQHLPEGVVAETWEISDYRDTTGTVLNGALAGRTLHELVAEHPDAVVGSAWQQRKVSIGGAQSTPDQANVPQFPLLEKFLDASHMLPVHLHADDETARRIYHEPNGKTEAWHILWAAPGASILAGVKPGLTRDDLFAAFKAQDYDSVMPRHPIVPGDTIYVPGGILHAFGPDTLIFEVQQTSDLAQTVMPIDLYGNRLSEERWDANINATLDELRTGYLPRPHHGLALPDAGTNRYRVCCAGPHFALERWTIVAPHTEHLTGERFLTLSNVGDLLRLDYQGGTETLARGESCLLPAALGEIQITPEGTGSGELIVCYLPDLERDIVTRLREAGHDDGAIRALGEVGI